MKQVLLSLVACLLAAGWAQGQQPQPPAQAPKQGPAVHQVALIDMAHIFKNYKKFTTLTEALQAEVKASDDELAKMVEQAKTQQQVLTSGNLVEGSPEFAKAEATLLEMQTAMQTFDVKRKRDFLKREADMYKTVYLEVEDSVKRYAEYFHFTLVLRFNRQSVDSADNPRDIINGMNRQVVYHRESDDITDDILNYLNSEWEAKQGRSATRP